MTRSNVKSVFIIILIVINERISLSVRFIFPAIFPHIFSPGRFITPITHPRSLPARTFNLPSLFRRLFLIVRPPFASVIRSAGAFFRTLLVLPLRAASAGFTTGRSRRTNPINYPKQTLFSPREKKVPLD